MALTNIESLVKFATGLDPASMGPSAIERAVRQRQRATGMDDLEAYWLHLNDSSAELQALIETVVVAETWFFRDEDAFARLAVFAQDEWPRANRRGAMRLLSLPCATGEEPYSMTITLLDAGLPADRFRVDAVDISERVLEQARRGAYTRGAFRTILADARQRRFALAPGGWRVTDAVRRQVQFHQANIFSDALLPGAEPYDVIFSRNLLIYFDRATQERAIDVIARLLAPNGLVFVGPAETVAFINRGFIPERAPRAFAFRKSRAFAAPARPNPTGKPLHVVPRGADHRMPPSPTSGPHTRVAADGPGHARASALEAGMLLANAGRFEDAEQCCRDSIERHGPSPDAFYLLGLIRDAAGNALEAMSAYRKALYLDPNHEDALMHLALLLESLDRQAEAQRLRSRARRAALRSGA